MRNDLEQESLVENDLEQDFLIELTPEQEQLLKLQTYYLSVKEMFNKTFLSSNILTEKPDETPFKDWKLEDIITYCVKYDYKNNSISNYEQALNEIYQRQKAKSGFYLIKDVKIVSNRVHGMSNCLGIFLWPREDLRSEMCTIFVLDDRYNRRNGYTCYAANKDNIGTRYLHTFFHESQHENQFSNVARFMQHGRLSGKDKVASLITLVYGNENDYYARYVEYDAQATAIKKMFKLYNNGILNKTNDLMISYEYAVRFLENYKANKVVKSARKFLPTIISAVAVTEPDKIRTLTDTDVKAFERYIEETYKTIQGIKAEYEKELLSRFSDDFKDKMRDEAHRLACLKQAKYEYQTKFLEKMECNPYQIDFDRSMMFLICYSRAMTKIEFEEQEKNEQSM